MIMITRSRSAQPVGPEKSPPTQADRRDPFASDGTSVERVDVGLDEIHAGSKLATQSQMTIGPDTNFGTFDAFPVSTPVVLPSQWSDANEPVSPPKTDPGKLETVPSESIPPRDQSFVWDVGFDRLTMSQSVSWVERLVDRREPSYAITANLNYVMLHHQLPELVRVTRQADLILADGHPIVWWSRRGTTPLPERVAGSELIHHLAALAARRNWGIYFLGGIDGVAQRCADRLAEAHPGMRIAGVESPPFRTLTPEERDAQRQRIQLARPEILLVAFGQPKGELWIHEHYRDYGVPVSIQLGASFDFVSGNAKRAPKFLQRWGMEWAYRMMGDPKRLIPRYAANARFLMKAICASSWGQTDRRLASDARCKSGKATT